MKLQFETLPAVGLPLLCPEADAGPAPAEAKLSVGSAPALCGVYPCHQASKARGGFDSF
jgi:hypothetical protein